MTRSHAEQEANYKAEAKQALDDANAIILKEIRSLDFTENDIRAQYEEASSCVYSATQWAVVRFGTAGEGTDPLSGFPYSWSNPDTYDWKNVTHTTTLGKVPGASLLNSVVGALVDYSHVATRHADFLTESSRLTSGKSKDALDFAKFIQESGCTAEDFESFQQKSLDEIAASVVGDHVRKTKSSAGLAAELQLLSTMPWWNKVVPHLSTLRAELLDGAMKQVSAHLAADGDAVLDSKEWELVGLLDQTQIKTVSAALAKAKTALQKLAPSAATDEYAPKNTTQLITEAKQKAEKEVKAIFETALEGSLGAGVDTAVARINRTDTEMGRDGR